MRNLALETEYAGRVAEMEARLQAFMAKRHDDLVPCHTYEGWYDNQRRVVRNAYGALSHPESEPDWSLLSPSS